MIQDIERLKKIKELRNKGMTLQEIGDFLEPKITRERVRQILLVTKKDRCKKHQVNYFEEKCPICDNVELYSEFLKNSSLNDLINDCYRLSKENREKFLVIQRTLIVKHLKDKFNFSFTQISKLLNKKVASVMFLYRKQI